MSRQSAAGVDSSTRITLSWLEIWVPTSLCRQASYPRAWHRLHDLADDVRSIRSPALVGGLPAPCTAEPMIATVGRGRNCAVACRRDRVELVADQRQLGQPGRRASSADTSTST